MRKDYVLFLCKCNDFNTYGVFGRDNFHNEEQQLIALPASWTDVGGIDPLVSVGNGRALFRADDLCELAALVRRLLSRGGNDV